MNKGNADTFITEGEALFPVTCLAVFAFTEITVVKYFM